MSEVTKPRFRPMPALLALGCAAGALGLALHHPLSSALAVVCVLIVVVTAAWRPLWVPVLILALLPVVDLAPRTGWMLVEEFDLLLLALLAGGWARMAWPGAARCCWWMAPTARASAI